MDPADQSNIPTKPDIVPGSGKPALGISDSQAGPMFGAGRSQGSGGAWQPPSPEELQRDFPQYEIRGILGRGGMGAVYKGWQKSLDRFVAIKILPPGMDDGIAGFTERFKREAKAMAQLEHPGIVAVHDAGTTPSGLLYFVMQCIEGTDVQKLVSARGRLDPAEALRITSAVCDALGYAHEHGIVHRDIKPSNIMLDAHGTVKVADFGLVKSTNTETTMLTGSNVAMGTPDFMAPEALKGAANADHRADLFAVGVMLYQMLTGELPRGRFVPPSRAVPGLDKRLDAIVDKALQPEPAARYSSALELGTAIEPVLAKLGGTRRSARVSSGSDAPRSARRATRSTLAAVAVVVIAAGAFFALWKSGKWRSAKSEQSSPALQRVEPSATDGHPDGLKPSNTLPAALSPSPSPQVPGAASTFPPGKWTKVFTKFEDIPAILRSRGGLEWREGWIDGTALPGSPMLPISGTRGRNQGIRLHGRIVASAGVDNVNVCIAWARRTDAGVSYRLAFGLRRVAADVPNVGLSRYDETAKKSAGVLAAISPKPPPKQGDEFDMELIVIGDKLYSRFNGKPLPVATDAQLTEGELGLRVQHQVRDIEVINLDGLSEAEARKAAGIEGK